MDPQTSQIASADADAGWWARPCGGRDVLRLALPMVASTMSWTLMSFVDSIILSKVSLTAMSAAFSASLTWFAMMSLLWGLCSYGSTFVSQYFGDDQPEKIGPVVWQGAWLALGFTPFALAAISLGPRLFSDHAPEMAKLESDFFRVLCFGAPGMLIAQSLEAFYSGRGKTYVVMCVDAAAVCVNIVLACVLVLGWFGFPSLGVRGAACATVLAQSFRAATYAVLALSAENRRLYHTWDGIRFDWPLLKRILRYGGPSGVQMMLDIVGFTYFVHAVGTLGLLEAEATSMAFRVSHVAFMPVWGVGIATSILVGQKLGEDRADLAERAAYTSVAINLGYMGFISLLFVLAPGIFLQAFSGGHDGGAAENLAPVRELAVHLLRFVAAYNLFDALVITFVSALKGAGDTRFIMKVSIYSASLLTFLTWMAVDRLNLGIYGSWTVITLFIWGLAVAYVLRFRQGNWRLMRVIDQVHHGVHDVGDGVENPVAERIVAEAAAGGTP